LDEDLVFAFGHMKWKRLGTEAGVHHLGADLPLTENMGISEVKKPGSLLSAMNTNK
jgi:hypothetical protein